MDAYSPSLVGLTMLPRGLIYSLLRLNTYYPITFLYNVTEIALPMSSFASYQNTKVAAYMKWSN